MGVCERALVVEVSRQTVPVFETDFEDFDLVDFGDEKKIVQRFQQTFVHITFLDQGAVLLQEGAEK